MNEDWDTIADWYAGRLRAGSPLHEFARDILLDRVPEDLAGRCVLDLGCGEGIITRGLAARGAKVWGIDSAPRMIDHALAAERTQPSGARYAVDDGCVLRTVATGTMALVTAGLSLNNVPDLRLALVSVRRILVSGGRLAFTVPHPCFETPDAVWISDHCGVPRRVIGDYTVERFWRSANPQGARRAGTYHRTLSTYLNTLVEVGFTVDLVAEPMPTPKVVGAHPARIALPPFLVVGCRLP